MVPMIAAAGLAATASAPASVAETAATTATTTGAAASTAIGVLPATPAQPQALVGPSGSAEASVDPRERARPAAQGDGFAILGDGPVAIPELVYYAYRAAEMQLAVSSPECALPWHLLAAVGRLTSDHGDGGRTDVLGTLAAPKVAPDGRIGPMLLPPAVWQEYAADGNADGATDPQNVFDSTLAAGAWMCSVGGPVRDGDGESRAVALFDSSPGFLADVREWSAKYAKAAQVAPAVPIPAPVPPSTSATGTVDVAATVPATAAPDAPTGDTGENETPDERVVAPGLPALPEFPGDLAELPCLVPGVCE